MYNFSIFVYFYLYVWREWSIYTVCIQFVFHHFRLSDDDDDVRNTARTLWTETGKQYEMENEDQLKEVVNFDIEMCSYPAGGKLLGFFHCSGDPAYLRVVVNVQDS